MDGCLFDNQWCAFLGCTEVFGQVQISVVTANSVGGKNLVNFCMVYHGSLRFVWIDFEQKLLGMVVLLCSWIFLF